MRKASIILICLLFAVAYFICGKSFAQKDTSKSEGTVEAVEAIEDNIIESAPIQAPIALGSEVKEEAAVDDNS